MPLLIASEVMDSSAAAINDADRTVYSYAIQIPYLKMALQELQEIFELNALPVTEQSSSVILIRAGQTQLQFNVQTSARLPDNLIDPQRLWESNQGIDTFIPMIRKSFMPHAQGGIETSQFTYWVWQDMKIILPSANRDNDIKIDYIGSLFPKYVSENTIIPVQNGIGFLSYRTGALIAEFVENNAQKAQSLNGFASLALDRISGISIKGKQQIMARRRPFRASYKSRGYYS